MRIVVLGNGGHANALGRSEERIESDDLVPVDAEVMIGVGDLARRRALFEKFAGRVIGYQHNSAAIAPDVEWGEGVQIMAGAIIQPGCVIGDNVLINTRASVDHDCRIGSHSHIAPGAVLCGNVTLGEGCFIGAGAVIVQGVTLEAGTFVPAGTLVVRHDDMRPAQRVVRGIRAANAALEAAARDLYDRQLRVDHHPDSQSGGSVAYPCDTERP